MQQNNQQNPTAAMQPQTLQKVGNSNEVTVNLMTQLRASTWHAAYKQTSSERTFIAWLKLSHAGFVLLYLQSWYS